MSSNNSSDFKSPNSISSSSDLKSPNLKTSDVLQRKRDRRRRHRQRRKYLAKVSELDKVCGTRVSSPRESTVNTRETSPRAQIEFDISRVVYSECWYANVKIGGVLVEALIDSGAELSLLSADVYEQLSNDGGYVSMPSQCVSEVLEVPSLPWALARLTCHLVVLIL